ncbi:macrolide family glycosyltransferase [Paenibacillus sp. SI8]|uniref:macrolide family glycosyltransferase n=1 Tax=unclassified Paenibacillus TaxID=185978 RepID=UPI0034662A21
MGRALFISAPAEGHINPTLGIVRELINRGEEVIYFTSDNYKEKVEQTGARVYTYHNFLESFLNQQATHFYERVELILNSGRLLLPLVLDKLQGIQFDYIIHDSMFGCGRLLAKAMRLPSINSCTTFALTKTQYLHLEKGFLHNADEKAGTLIYARCLQLMKEIERRYGIRIQSNYEIFFNPAALTIVYTSKQFQPYGDHFDNSYKFIGPSLFHRSDKNEFDLESVRNSKVIYISMGTIYNNLPEFYKLCIHALKDINARIIISVGSQIDLEEFSEIPPNVSLEKKVAQLEILKYTNVFITHGGMNSVQEALVNGVPLLMIPQGADQPIVSKRVVEFGAGICFEKDTITSDLLRSAVEKLLNDQSYSTNSRNLGDSMTQTGGYLKAVDEIMTYTQSLVSHK